MDITVINLITNIEELKTTTEKMPIYFNNLNSGHIRSIITARHLGNKVIYADRNTQLDLKSPSTSSHI